MDDIETGFARDYFPDGARVYNSRDELLNRIVAVVKHRQDNISNRFAVAEQTTDFIQAGLDRMFPPNVA